MAIDGDREINNKIRYSLTTNNIDQMTDVFKIEKDTGKVVTASELDREALSFGSSSYVLQITAIEVGSRQKPPPHATTEVTVMITDVNDETPSFKSHMYECEIAENAPKNTPVTFIGNSIPEVFDYDQVSIYINQSNNLTVLHFRIGNKRYVSHVRTKWT